MSRALRRLSAWCEPLAVRRRRGAAGGGESPAGGDRIAEAACVGNLGHRPGGGLQQRPGFVQKPGVDPFRRAGAGGLGEPAVEVAGAHARTGGQCGDAEIRVEVGQGPFDELADRPPFFRFGQRPFDVLGLAAFPVRRDEQAPRDLRGGRRTEPRAHHVQAGVECGGGAGAGQHVAVVDVEGIGVDVDGGEAFGEFARRGPMRHRAPAVEDPAARYGEGAEAQAGDEGAAIVRPANQCGQRLGRGPEKRVPRGKHQEIGVLRGLRAGQIRQHQPLYVRTGSPSSLHTLTVHSSSPSSPSRDTSPKTSSGTEAWKAVIPSKTCTAIRLLAHFHRKGSLAPLTVAHHSGRAWQP